MASMANDATADLRRELKGWEQEFAARHGRKPSREDIRGDKTIADKYRRFNRSRQSQPRTNELPTTPSKSHRYCVDTRHALSDKCVNTAACTSSTPRKHMPTAEQQHQQQQPPPPVPTPSHIRCALGPTPQKDGHVLGLFDSIAVSPIVSSPDDAMPKDVNTAMFATPGKVPKCSSTAARYSRTPQSSGKRYYLDAFAGTPLKRKRDDTDDDLGTPASIKRTFATPAFLRRDTALETHSQDDAAVSAVMGRKKKSLVRSLSTIIANLRKNEDEQMDEEWQIMRELEGDTADTNRAATTLEELDVEEIAMPLGPDQSIEEEESEVEDASVRKPWKKKGLKRQTKKSNMKPVLHAPRKAAEIDSGEQNEGKAIGKPADEETQAADKTSGVVKKALRKVNEAAHMNFRRLKIKNKNSKAGGRGRFGRR